MSRSLDHLKEVLTLTIGRIGAKPDDSRETRQQKALLVGSTLMILLAGIVWGSFYLTFGESQAALIPFGYSTLSALNLAAFALLRRYEPFRFGQFLFILLLPFLLGIALGGYVNSSAVILWSLLSPISALLFAGTREAVRWFVAYLALVVASALLQPRLSIENNLPPTVVLSFFVMNIGAISTVAFILIHYFISQKNLAMHLLRIEQEKTETLLLNVLPEEIANTLKQGDRTIADQFDAVSVLFADLVGFTPLSAHLKPAETVNLLNEIFMHFDSLVEKYKVEKIRTIGDSYMVAAGVPCARDGHAHALARMALDMRNYVGSLPLYGGHRIDFRIGINSGPVVAGVIGRKKFQYDLWGDTVNTASRMESHGVGGKIQITRETYELLKDEFVCEPRGKVIVKGKGEMETWYLTGARADVERAL